MKQDKSTILVNSMEGTNKQIPQQSQSQRKNKNRDKSASTDRSTMIVDLMEENDRNSLPKPKERLLTHASTNYCIEGTMGHDNLSPPINTEDLEWYWHLFELTIVGEELRDQQHKIPPNSEKTKSKQIQTDMAPKLHGSVNDTVEVKAQATAEAKKKAVGEEKKLSVLQ